MIIWMMSPPSIPLTNRRKFPPRIPIMVWVQPPFMPLHWRSHQMGTQENKSSQTAPFGQSPLKKGFGSSPKCQTVIHSTRSWSDNPTYLRFHKGSPTCSLEWTGILSGKHGSRKSHGCASHTSVIKPLSATTLPSFGRVATPVIIKCECAYEVHPAVVAQETGKSSFATRCLRRHLFHLAGFKRNWLVVITTINQSSQSHWGKQQMLNAAPAAAAQPPFSCGKRPRSSDDLSEIIHNESLSNDWSAEIHTIWWIVCFLLCLRLWQIYCLQLCLLSIVDTIVKLACVNT